MKKFPTTAPARSLRPTSRTACLLARSSRLPRTAFAVYDRVVSIFGARTDCLQRYSDLFVFSASDMPPNLAWHWGERYSPTGARHLQTFR